jgi:hypothetical protein
MKIMTFKQSFIMAICVMLVGVFLGYHSHPDEQTKLINQQALTQIQENYYKNGFMDGCSVSDNSTMRQIFCKKVYGMGVKK